MSNEYVCEECGEEFDNAAAYGGHVSSPHDRPWRDEETLEGLYVGQGLTLDGVADELDCSVESVKLWMDKHGIERRSHAGVARDMDYKQEDWLREKYHEERMNTCEIADSQGVSETTIRHYMDKFGIDRIPGGPKQTPPKLFTDWNGYECFHAGDNDRFRHHRLLAVATHGFDSVVGKVVHHKNRVTWDNRPANIELMTAVEHSKHHIHEHKPWEGNLND